MYFKKEKKYKLRLQSPYTKPKFQDTEFQKIKAQLP